MIARSLRGLAFLTLTMVLGDGTVLAQVPPQEHEQHHPAGAVPPASTPAPPPSAPATSAPGPALPMDMGRMMREMERMMPGSPLAPLVSRALGTAHLSPSERDRLRADAERQLARGQALVQRSARELDAALAAGNRPRADRAIAGVREGASDVETARGVLDALALPPEQTEARALAWFKREMNVVDNARAVAAPWSRQWILVAIFGAVSLAGVGLYLYKVARSVRWLARLTRPEPPR